ncbi:MAG: hypothetical protein MJE77_14685 [Proteobacteria bacterium]|nr:hypothetical protein [Pseudomonadota bacterium]
MSQDDRDCLAVLIAAIWPGESAMHDDTAAVYRALRQRGVTADQIWTLEGSLSAELVMAFLAAAQKHIADWTRGNVFLYYSGHGAYIPVDATSPTRANPAMRLRPGRGQSPDQYLLWSDALATLSLPKGLHLTVLPDC